MERSEMNLWNDVNQLVSQIFAIFRKNMFSIILFHCKLELFSIENRKRLKWSTIVQLFSSIQARGACFASLFRAFLSFHQQYCISRSVSYY